MIIIKSRWLLVKAFGFPKGVGGPIAMPAKAWFDYWLEHGFRNWRRGYKDEDCHSLMEKLSFPPSPGRVTWLTRREMNAFRDWYGKNDEQRDDLRRRSTARILAMLRLANQTREIGGTIKMQPPRGRFAPRQKESLHDDGN